MLVAGIVLLLVGLAVTYLTNESRFDRLGYFVAVIGVVVIVLWLLLLLLDEGGGTEVGALLLDGSS